MDWDVKPIVEVAFIQEGPGIRKYEYQEGGYPMINVRCVQNGYIDMTSARAANRDLAVGKWAHFQIDAGDILFTISGTIGRCAIVRESDLPILMNTSVVRFKPTDPNLDARFLYYFLQSEDFQGPLKELSSGAAIQNVGPTHIKTLSVPCPPSAEQKRIVAVLDQAFAALDRARAHAEANLADAQRLFGLEVDRMRRSPAPSWPVLKLEKLAAVISGQHILAGEYNSERRGIGYLTGPSDFGDKRPIVSKWTEYPKRTAIRGDILITVKGSGVGSLNMMVEDELAISRQLMAIRTKPNLREFIYLTLEASYQHFQGLANGAAIPGISRSDVLDFELAMPTSAELPSLLNRLRTLRANSDRLAQGYSDRLTDIANLRQSLLQKAFSGELT